MPEVDQDGFQKHPLTWFILNKVFLKKKKDLLFKIINNTVPQPYEIKWKVRNFGEDAKRAGCLRGEISDDSGKFQKKESTAYEGEHYVECYVIKDNICIAMDKILVPIGNEL